MEKTDAGFYLAVLTIICTTAIAIAFVGFEFRFSVDDNVVNVTNTMNACMQENYALKSNLSICEHDLEFIKTATNNSVTEWAWWNYE